MRVTSASGRRLCTRIAAAVAAAATPTRLYRRDFCFSFEHGGSTVYRALALLPLLTASANYQLRTDANPTLRVFLRRLYKMSQSAKLALCDILYKRLRNTLTYLLT